MRRRMMAAVLLSGCATDGASASEAGSETGTTATSNSSNATSSSSNATNDETTTGDPSTSGDSIDTSTSATESGTISAELLGAVAKGPFLIGSSIEAAELDENLSPTGNTFSTQTLTDLGEFELAVETAGRLSIEAVGFYYNEVTGELSESSLTLRAFFEANAEGEQPAFVNVVTHLAYGRVQELYGDGLAFTPAVSQAEDELLVALGVGIAGFDPGAEGTAMNLLGGDTDANAYLFAVATVLAQAAVTRAGGVDGPVDANLQEIINTIADDIRLLGQISPALRDELLQAQRDVDSAAVMAAFAQRLVDLRSTAEVPDLDRILDNDLDGIVNRDDNCPFVENVDQLDSDTDGVGDACECGNGTIDVGETCDDDNEIPFDGCEPDCTPTCVEVLTGETGDAIEPLGMIDDVLVYLHYAGASVAYAFAPGGEPESLGTFCNGPLFGFDGIRFAIGCSGEESGLWVTDGTPAGTQQLVDVDTSTSNIGFVVDGAFLFGVSTGVGYELWRSDGTVGGTMALGPGAPVVRAATLAGEWYFRGAPGAVNTLWSTDATGPGTQLVYDFAVMNGVGIALVALDNRLLTYTGGSQPLWSSDGTPVGTENLAVGLTLLDDADVFAVLGGVGYFGALAGGTVGLWRSSGSAADTSEVVGLGAASGAVIDIQTIGDRVVFIRTDNGGDDEIWTSDGTPGGTAPVPVVLGEVPRGYPPIGGHYYFQADDDGSGTQMWRTDGTASGTAFVVEAGPGFPLSYSTPLSTGDGHAYITTVAADGVSSIATLHRCAVPM